MRRFSDTGSAEVACHSREDIILKSADLKNELVHPQGNSRVKPIRAAAS
jgi:hypothetical protein